MNYYRTKEAQLPIREGTERQRVYVVCYGEDGNECVIYGVFTDKHTADIYEKESPGWTLVIDVDWYKADGWK